MIERNFCTSSGCFGYCCEDIDIEVTDEERIRVFPFAKEVFSVEEIEMTKKQKEQGVFYCTSSNCRNVLTVAINGPCPNRGADGSCKVYRMRESAAKNFRPGCDDCNFIRKKHGLGPIFIEPVE